MGCGKSSPVVPYEDHVEVKPQAAPSGAQQPGVVNKGSSKPAGEWDLDDEDNEDQEYDNTGQTSGQASGLAVTRKAAATPAKAKGGRAPPDGDKPDGRIARMASRVAGLAPGPRQADIGYPIRQPEPRPWQYELVGQVFRNGTWAVPSYSVEVVKVVRGMSWLHRTHTTPVPYLDALEVNTGVCRQAIDLLTSDVSVTNPEWVSTSKFDAKEPEEEGPVEAPDPLRSPTTRPLVFKVARRETFEKKDEPVYSVEVSKVVRGVCHLHRTRMSTPDALDAIGVNTRIVRKELRTLGKPESVVNAEWMPWQKWHPDGQPWVRGRVAVYGVPWHTSMQLGVLDGALYTNAEPAACMQVGVLDGALCTNAEPAASTEASKPPESVSILPRRPAGPAPRVLGKEDISKSIAERGKRLGLESLEATALDDGTFSCEDNNEEVPRLRDPFEASKQELEEHWKKAMSDAIQSNEGSYITDEEIAAMARWHFAKAARAEHLKVLPRPGYWQDMPFYSVVEPLAKRKTGYMEGPVPFPKQPGDNEVPSTLEKLSALSGQSRDYDDMVEAEEQRMAFVKSIKWSADMKLPLWRAERLERDGPGPTFRWVKVDKDELRDELHYVNDPPLEHTVEQLFSDMDPHTLDTDVADYEGWRDGLRGLQDDEDWNEEWWEAHEMDDARDREPLWEEAFLEEDRELWVLSLRAPDPERSRQLLEGQDAPWDDEWYKAKPAWYPLPDSVMNKGDEGELDNVVAKEMPSEEKLAALRQRRNLPEAWAFEILIPDDYSPDVAAHQLEARRATLRAQWTLEYDARAELGSHFAVWPENRHWKVVPLSEAWRRQKERLARLKKSAPGKTSSGSEDNEDNEDNPNLEHADNSNAVDDVEASSDLKGVAESGESAPRSDLPKLTYDEKYAFYELPSFMLLGPAISITGRPQEPRKYNNPGPGSYDAWFLGKSRRFLPLWHRQLLEAEKHKLAPRLVL